MIRYMNPFITKEHYRGSTKTHFEPVPEDFYDDDFVAKRKAKFGIFDEVKKTEPKKKSKKKKSKKKKAPVSAEL